MKFRLHGNRKASILKKDVMASNGLIHVINRLMTDPQEVRADDKVSYYKLCKLKQKCIQLTRHPLWKTDEKHIYAVQGEQPTWQVSYMVAKISPRCGPNQGIL